MAWLTMAWLTASEWLAQGGVYHNEEGADASVGEILMLVGGLLAIGLISSSLVGIYKWLRAKRKSHQR